MESIKCEICGKVFDSKRKLSGHMKVHKPGYEEQKKLAAENARKRAKEQYEKDKAEYDVNPIKCLVCGTPLDFDKAIKRHAKFCSPSCIVTWGNLHRDTRSEESKNKTRESVTKYWKTEKGQKRIKEQKIIRICALCGKEFTKKKGMHRSNKYCSEECALTAISKNRIEKIVKDGGSNFATKWDLSYKGNDYKCDSLLEAAAIIWLIDKKNATSIKRSTTILEFVASDNKVHRYNPDLIAEIDNETWVIEVKQDREKSATSKGWERYCLFWDEKKKVLADYASENNYKWLWLNPQHDSEFKRLYRSVMLNKKLYNLTKSHCGEV